MDSNAHSMEFPWNGKENGDRCEGYRLRRSATLSGPMSPGESSRRLVPPLLVNYYNEFQFSVLTNNFRHHFLPEPHSRVSQKFDQVHSLVCPGVHAVKSTHQGLELFPGGDRGLALFETVATDLVRWVLQN